jgi:hypothetical protein
VNFIDSVGDIIILHTDTAVVFMDLVTDVKVEYAEPDGGI